MWRSPRGKAAVAVSVLALAVASLAPGCQVRPRAGLGGRAGPGGDIAAPFAPDAIRLHPLTRVDRDSAGLPMLVVYMDVRDSWDDPVKAIGMLEVQLYRPASGPASNMDEQELTWNLDLSDLELNSKLYDPVTHMYRLPLLEAPEWIIPEQGRDAPRLRLRAILNTYGPRGEARQLDDNILFGG
jgi:hypothetical protein